MLFQTTNLQLLCSINDISPNQKAARQLLLAINRKGVVMFVARNERGYSSPSLSSYSTCGLPLELAACRLVVPLCRIAGNVAPPPTLHYFLSFLVQRVMGGKPCETTMVCPPPFHVYHATVSPSNWRVGEWQWWVGL